MKRFVVLFTCFLPTAAFAAVNTPPPPPATPQDEVVATVSAHPATVLYNGRLPDVYTKGAVIDGIETMRPFFSAVEIFLCKVERLDKVSLIINVVDDLKPAVVFDNASIAETHVATLSANRNLFIDFTPKQLEVALALIIATYSPARKGLSDMDISPISLAKNMPTNVGLETAFGLMALTSFGLGISQRETAWLIASISGLILSSVGLIIAQQARQGVMTQVPQVIFKHLRTILTNSTRRELAKNPNHYLQAIALLSQVVSHNVRENFFIEVIFIQIFKKFSEYTAELQNNTTHQEAS